MNIKIKKIKIYYNKNTKKFAGAGNIGNKFKEKKDLVKFLEITEKEWIEFHNLNKKKQIYIRNGKLESEDIEIPLEILKNIQIKKRSDYLNSTDWYGIRSINGKKVPKEIQNKREKARKEINEIKEVDNLKDLKKYE